VPVFVDIDPLTLNIDCEAIEAQLSPATRAILVPNLAGNVPDWDRIRQIADRHGLKVIEDSCDTIAPTLRGTPTSTRADLSLTSFNLSHILTCAGQGGMLLTDDQNVRARALLMRRWGRRSEAVAYDHPPASRSFNEDLDGVEYDSFNIFDELAWNFEPSEMGAAFGLEQMKRLPEFAAQRKRNFRRYQEILSRHPGNFIVPQEIDGVETTWQVFVATVDPAAGFGRAEVQDFMYRRDIETRTVWTGNIVRQPMLRNTKFRTPAAGLPHADAIFERGIAFPCNQGISDAAMDYVAEAVDAFVAEQSARTTPASAGVPR
jgi:CDP-6-deoxy-D-xylo-4-hexulose-3-dehydrase